MTGPIAWTALKDAATEVHARAYAPYSKFRVGAALLGANGTIYQGCNVENVSYGATLCAERGAVAAAVAAGERSLEALVIVADSSEPTPPCGVCRQVLAELNPKLRIRSYTGDGKMAAYDLDVLLPDAFTPDHLA